MYERSQRLVQKACMKRANGESDSNAADMIAASITMSKLLALRSDDDDDVWNVRKSNEV